MSDLTRPGAVPLRPLTTGELLDGAIAVLRTRPWGLVGLGALLGLIEQLALYPLRAQADLDIRLLPATGRLSEYGWLIVAGFGTEAFIIAVLATVAARRGGSVLLGRFAPPLARLRWGQAGAVAILAGLAAAASVLWLPGLLDGLNSSGIVLAWLLTLLAWTLPYGLLGLATSAVAIENCGAFAALGRSMRLAGRDGMRAVWIRVLGYLSWALVRIGLILAVIALTTLIWGGNLPSSTWDRVLMAAAAVVVNAVAYPVLGCLDVMLLLEGRMRTEGLDIALRWALRRGVAPSLEAR